MFKKVNAYLQTLANGRRKRLFALIALLSMVPLFFATRAMITVFAQMAGEDDKIITKVSFRSEPIEFVSVESDQERITIDQKFRREGDWLTDLTFRFKNISEKPITFIQIALVFPETGSVPLVHLLQYGTPPGLKSEQSKTPVEIIDPGREAMIRLSPEQFQGLKKFVGTRKRLSQLTQVNYRIMTVYFQDNSRWIAGSMSRPDPDHPDKYVPIAPSGKEDKHD